MVGVASSIPCWGNFTFVYFKTPRSQFCTKLPEMSDLCYLGKTRMVSLMLKRTKFDFLRLCQVVLFTVQCLLNQSHRTVPQERKRGLIFPCYSSMFLVSKNVRRKLDLKTTDVQMVFHNLFIFYFFNSIRFQVGQKT